MSLSRFSFLGNYKKYKKFVFYFVLVLLVAGIALLAKSMLYKNQASVAYSDSRTEIPGAKNSINIEREFTYPIKDSKGQEVSRIKLVIQNAELRDQIVVKGKKATSVKGRTFLIINMKISNEYNRSIELNTSNYIRLSVNNNEQEWLAPDIHNDPVTIQAISTKYTRVGFPINDTDKSLKIRVGEIEGEKQVININF